MHTVVRRQSLFQGQNYNRRRSTIVKPRRASIDHEGIGQQHTQVKFRQISLEARQEQALQTAYGRPEFLTEVIEEDVTKRMKSPHAVSEMAFHPFKNAHVPKVIEEQTEKVLAELGFAEVVEDLDMSPLQDPLNDFEKVFEDHFMQLQRQFISGHDSLATLVDQHMEAVRKLESQNRRLHAQLAQAKKDGFQPGLGGPSRAYTHDLQAVWEDESSQPSGQHTSNRNGNTVVRRSQTADQFHHGVDSSPRKGGILKKERHSVIEKPNLNAFSVKTEKPNMNAFGTKPTPTLPTSPLMQVGGVASALPPVEPPPGLQDGRHDGHLPGVVDACPTSTRAGFDKIVPEENPIEEFRDVDGHDDQFCKCTTFDTCTSGFSDSGKSELFVSDLVALDSAESTEEFASNKNRQQKAGFDEGADDTKEHTGMSVKKLELSPRQSDGLRLQFGEATIQEDVTQDDAASSEGEESDDEAALHFQILDVWTANSEIQGHKLVGANNIDSSGSKKNTALIRAATAAVVDVQEEEGGPVEQPSKYRKLMSDPGSPHRVGWEMFGVLMVVYDVVSIPLVLLDPPKNDVTTRIDWATRLFWTLDIPFTFMTGYMLKNGNVVLDPMLSAQNYLKSWFCLDFFLVSTDWAELAWGGYSHAQGSARISRIFRIMRLMRLVRIARMKDFLKSQRTRLRSEGLLILIDIGKILVGLLAVTHYIACMWYGMAQSEPGDSWVTENGYNRKPLEQSYLMAFHWSMAQFHGGMDEIVPVGVHERLYAVFVSVLSWLAAAAFVSGLTSEMTRLHILASQQARQLSVLNRYLKQCRISDHLSIRVQRNAQHALHEQQRLMPESEVELLHLVSEALREELHFEMYSPVLEVHSFFAVYTSECPQVIRKVCHIAMSTLLISTGDVVFNAGEIPQLPKMYIVCSGTLDYIPLSGNVIEVFSEHWLSEAVLWTHWMHRGVLKATHDGRLCCLDALRFQEIVGCFDHSPQQIDPKNYARLYVEHLNSLLDQNDLDKITDMPNDEEVYICKRAMNREGERINRSGTSDVPFTANAKRRRSAFMEGSSKGAGSDKIRALKRSASTALSQAFVSTDSKNGNARRKSRDNAFLQAQHESPMMSQMGSIKSISASWTAVTSWMNPVFRSSGTHKESRTSGSPMESQRSELSSR